MPTAKEDAQSLVDELMPFAKQMLTTHGEFMPYGGHMKLNGEIVHEGATTGEERSRSQPLIDILRSSHSEAARDGRIRAACIVYDILIAPPEQSQKVDAIAFEIDHREEYSAVLFYPYALSGDEVVFVQAAFGGRGQNAIF